MSDDLTAPCEYCGDERVVVVRYRRDANEAQRRRDWFGGTPPLLYAVVCQGCGMGKATIDPRENEDMPDFEDLPDGTDDDSADDFRVDDTLE